MNSGSAVKMPTAQARTLVGRRVKLSGLVSKPELNGCTGRVMSLDERSGRASVRLAGSVKCMDAAPQIVSVRPLNLTPISEEPLPEGVISSRPTSCSSSSSSTARPHGMLCRCILDQPENPLPPLPAAADSDSAALPLVSVISPTSYERRWTHASLYQCFAHQRYPRKELIVLDTGLAPSPFFSRLSDDRVRYIHIMYDANGMKPEQAVESLRMLALAAPSETGDSIESTASTTKEPPSVQDRDPLDEWWRHAGKKDTTHAQAWAPTLSALSRAIILTQAAESSAFRQEAARDEDTARDEDGESLRSVEMAAAELVREGASIGAKRNWLAAKACGELQANFDDVRPCRGCRGFVHSDSNLPTLPPCNSHVLSPPPKRPARASPLSLSLSLSPVRRTTYTCQAIWSAWWVLCKRMARRW